MLPAKPQHQFTANALRYRPVSDEAREGLIKYFKDGHSPSSAYQSYKDKVLDKYGDEQFRTISADRSIVPDYSYV